QWQDYLSSPAAKEIDTLRQAALAATAEQPADASILPRWNDALNTRSAALRKIVGDCSDELAATLTALSDAAWREVAIYIAAALVVLGLVGIFNRFAIRNLRGIMRRMKDAMQALAEQKFAVEIEGANRSDDIGAMARTLLIFKDSLQERERLESAQKAD